MKLVEIAEQNLLHCFSNSWRLMMDMAKEGADEGLMLIHAFVTNIEGRTFPHGWLELNGKAIDSARSKENPLVMDANKYRDVMNATDIVEYTPEQAMIKAARERNLGPWDPRFDETT